MDCLSANPSPGSLPILNHVRPTCRPTRHRTVAIGLLLGLWASTCPAQITTLEPARFVRQREIRLTYATRGDANVDRVRVFVSIDGGRTWTPIDHRVVAPGTAEVAVRQEGRHDFFMVLENAAGTSSAPPVAGDRPHVSATVDTLPPTMQVHQANLERNAAGSLTARIKLSLIEENLSPDGIRVFYRAQPGADWTDAGSARYENGAIAIGLSSEIERADLRVVVTDLAGNRAFDDQLDVTAPRPEPVDTSTTLAAESSPEAPASVVVEIQPVAPPLPDDRTVALRRKADEHMQRGEYALAGARLSEALDKSPNDADLLADLGRAAYALRKTDEAALRFEQALTANPDHPDALEGMALVEVNRRQYPRAQEHLEHLLKLEPQSGRMWLNYGDVLHRMGETQDANSAWERVLQVDADQKTRENATKRLRYIGSLRDQTPK
jgi:tetratricopeptide (TPR) repeat protein